MAATLFDAGGDDTAISAEHQEDDDLALQTAGDGLGRIESTALLLLPELPADFLLPTASPAGRAGLGAHRWRRVLCWLLDGAARFPA